MKQQHIFLPLLIIGIAVLMRLIPHPANIAPVAAMALFGGAYLDKKYAIVLPLAAMFVSDIFLGFHASMPMVYVSFVLTALIGMWLKHHKSVHFVVSGSIASSLIFFLLTNFNYWYVASLYPKTLEGVVQSYVMAIPFFRNTLLGDLLYTGVFFGGYELLRVTLLRVHPNITAPKQ